MKQYEDALYEEWIESVVVILPNLLKKTLLAKPTQSIQAIDSRGGSRPVSKAEHSSHPQGI